MEPLLPCADAAALVPAIAIVTAAESAELAVSAGKFASGEKAFAVAAPDRLG
jgi:hypothetical protein